MPSVTLNRADSTRAPGRHTLSAISDVAAGTRPPRSGMSSATVAVAAAIAPRRASCDASRRERAARVIAGASASDIDRSRESDDDASRGVADDAADDARRRRRRRRDDHPSTSPSRRSLLLGAGALTASAATTTGGILRPDPARAFIDLPSRLHNRYFLVRHGESTLDTRSLVLSNPSFKYDTTYGLTPRGIEQMHEAARVMIEEHDAAPSWLYTSNFQRSFQVRSVRWSLYDRVRVVNADP